MSEDPLAVTEKKKTHNGDRWSEDGMIFYCDGVGYGVSSTCQAVILKAKETALEVVTEPSPDLSKPLLAPQEVVPKLCTNGIVLPPVMAHSYGTPERSEKHPGGRPRKPDSEEVSIRTLYRRKKELQGVLL